MLFAEQRSKDHPCSLILLSNTRSLAHKVKRILPNTLLQKTSLGDFCSPAELASLAEIDVVLLVLDTLSPQLLPTLSLWGQVSQPVIVLTTHLREEDYDLIAQAGISDAITLQGGLEQLVTRSINHLHNRANEAPSYEDPLTGLANRTTFYQRANEALRNPSLNTAVISLELDGFKKMLVQYGHVHSDRVLQQLSFRLKRALQSGFLCARFERDEFAILVCEADAQRVQSKASQLAQHLCRALSSPYISSDKSAILPCSLGVSVSDDASCTIDDLIRQASIARLQAKAQRNCSYKVYAPSVEETDSIERALEPELSTALRGGQFELFFQPQVSLKSGTITGAEALIRWQHPKRGLIMPNDFIPMSERNGMIIPMGYWAIYEAIHLLNRLHAAGHRNSEVAVNISFRQFQDTNLTKIIHRILTQNPIHSGRIKFELTETALVNDEQYVSECIKELAALNIEFALDDFGTGYSSFSLLQTLPINTVKIDRSFVRQVPENERDCNIVCAMISLAHNLGKTVIAEGVETEDQLDFLKSAGCDSVQGYYFSPPVHFDTYLDLLS